MKEIAIVTQDRQLLKKAKIAVTGHRTEIRWYCSGIDMLEDVVRNSQSVKNISCFIIDEVIRDIDTLMLCKIIDLLLPSTEIFITPYTTTSNCEEIEKIARLLNRRKIEDEFRKLAERFSTEEPLVRLYEIEEKFIPKPPSALLLLKFTSFGLSPDRVEKILSSIKNASSKLLIKGDYDAAIIIEGTIKPSLLINILVKNKYIEEFKIIPIKSSALPTTTKRIISAFENILLRERRRKSLSEADHPESERAIKEIFIINIAKESCEKIFLRMSMINGSEACWMSTNKKEIISILSGQSFTSMERVVRDRIHNGSQILNLKTYKVTGGL